MCAGFTSQRSVTCACVAIGVGAPARVSSALVRKDAILPQVPAPSISGFMNEVVWYQVHIKSLLWCTDRTFFVSSRETRRLSSVHNTRGLWQSCLQWSLWSAPGCGDRQQQYLRGVPISIDVDQPTLMRRTGARRMLSPVCRIEKENGLPACEY